MKTRTTNRMTSRHNEQKRLREVEHIRRKRERYSDRGGCSCRNLMVKHVTATPYKAMLIAILFKLGLSSAQQVCLIFAFLAIMLTA